MNEYTDVRLTAESDADWAAAYRVLQSLSDTYEPDRPTNRGFVWYNFRGSQHREVPVTLGVCLAGDVEAHVRASLASLAPPHLVDQFRVEVEDANPLI